MNMNFKPYRNFDPKAPSTKLIRHLNPKAIVPPASENAPPNTMDFRSSDQTLDRYQEIITVAGWKLANYRKNPIVQNAHSYCSLADTIGKSIITEVRGLQSAGTVPPLSPSGSASSSSSSSTTYLFQRIQFAVEENPLARIAYGLYKGGF